MYTPRRLSFIVPPHMDGVRVKSILQDNLHLSNTAIKHAKTTPDGLLLDGVPVFVSAIVRERQILSVLVGDVSPEPNLIPQEGSLHIVYEDEDILIVNKEAGIVVHPTRTHKEDTLGNFVAHYYQTTKQPIPFRPVHRLDRGTSGLLCIAKHAHAQERLKGQLHTAQFQRIYLAVCEGTPAPSTGTIDAPIAQPEDSVIKRVVSPTGAPATTHYEVIQSHGAYSLVRLALATGRTHQIRVHMAHIGHPLVGDFLYGTENHGLISRTALHATALSLTHPIAEERLSWQVPLPPDMAQLMNENG